jgi:hypothetical protein
MREINLYLIYRIIIFAVFVVHAQSLSLIDTTSPFKINFTREYSTPFELSLIKKAEDAKSPQEKKKYSSERQPIEIKLPPIVKNKKADFFRELIICYQNGDFSAIKPVAASSASLFYSANIEKQPKYTFMPPGKKKSKTLINAYIVNTELTFEQHCGIGCSLTFHNRKTVVFSSKGTILNVVSEFEVDRLQ